MSTKRFDFKTTNHLSGEDLYVLDALSLSGQTKKIEGNILSTKLQMIRTVQAKDEVYKRI